MVWCPVSYCAEGGIWSVVVVENSFSSLDYVSSPNATVGVAGRPCYLNSDYPTEGGCSRMALYDCLFLGVAFPLRTPHSTPLVL